MTHQPHRPPMPGVSKRYEQGFALIELMVVVVVLGLLSSIATIAYIQQRRTAFDGTIKADLTNVAKAEEAWRVSQGTQPAPAGTADLYELDKAGASYSPGNVIEISVASNGYCLRGSNPSGKARGAGNGGYYFFDSAAGGLQSKRSEIPPSGGACVSASSWVVGAPSSTPSTASPTTPATPAPTAPATTTPAAPAPTTPAPTPPPTPTTAPLNDDITDCDDSVHLTQPGSGGLLQVADATNQNANSDTYGMNNVWWHLRAAGQSGFVSVYLTDSAGQPLTGSRTLTVLSGKPGVGNGEKCTGPFEVVDSATSVSPALTFDTVNGQDNYYFMVSSSTPNEAPFVLNVVRGDTEPAGNAFASPVPVTVTANGSTLLAPNTTAVATSEPGEAPGGQASVWYSLSTATGTVSKLPTYTVTVNAAAGSAQQIGEHTIEVFSAGGTSASVPGTLVTSKTGGIGQSVTFTGPDRGAAPFKIRVRSAAGKESGAFRLTVARTVN